MSRISLERPDKALLKKLSKDNLIELVYRMIDGIEKQSELLEEAGSSNGYSDTRYEGERYEADISWAIDYIEEWVNAIEQHVENCLETGKLEDSYKWR